ncbi:3-oxoacyl-ACP reductase [Weissella diestrammenae]|uniref:3-oxoacyl-ACP reductase n=1 Tax=Weissella diestrammenae TaxID=1162633 RepID=A0A7G9T3V2_9LACO|nr:3-oxoacyl-ACP reductase [Weissella diestrammenae]MCM0582765.1 3-oxoacyl-ACP reductase [Weissella diestrammenae]QNN74777.1 3-oxoacyl-ACP reductase [Weissella diestrammenae]
MITQEYTQENVLITGAASGIGYAQMMAYLTAGANVIAIDKQKITLSHPKLTTYVVDLSDVTQMTTLLKDSILQEIDVFLNTAGVLDAFTPALETDYAKIQKVMTVNVNAAIQLTLAILPGMVKRQKGEIVYMASIAGQVAGGGGAAYTTSKHALVGWMRQLALDYAHDHIHINAIAPGAIKTPMNAADFAGDGSMAQSVAEQTPIQRWAQPEEVANLTLYVTSPEASYMQGQVLTLDGGWTLK